MRHLVIVLCLWLTTVVAFCADAPVRIAVLAGEGDRAPKAGLADLLEVEFSKREQVVLLERTEIRKVLAEQGLSAAGSDDVEAVGYWKKIGGLCCTITGPLRGHQAPRDQGPLARDGVLSRMKKPDISFQTYQSTSQDFRITVNLDFTDVDLEKLTIAVEQPPGAYSRGAADVPTEKSQE
jgi:hypothetical protein